MKNNLKLKPILLAIIVTIATLTASACSSSNDSPVKSDIEIIPEEQNYTYSQEEKDYARQTLYSVLCLSYAKDTEGLTAERENNAQRLSSYIVENGNFELTEEKYKKAFEAIEKSSADIAEGLAEIANGKISSGANKIKSTYIALDQLASADFATEIVYRLYLCSFDIKYDKQMSSYDKYGHAYMLDKAKEYERAKEIFINDIGKSNLEALIKYGYIYVELFYGGAFEGSFISEFSDEELLTLVKALDIDNITIKDTGWALLLSLYGEMNVLNVQNSFLNRVMFSATKNGDVVELARSTKELVSLLAIIQNELTVDDIKLIREGNANEAVIDALARFDDDSWASFDKAMPKNIDSQAYAELAKKHYGEDFVSYLNSYETATLEELKQSQGTADFYKTLKEYIAGICPAFSYAMN